MMKKILLALTCSAIVAGLSCTVARADIFTFSFTGSSDSGSGTFTGTPTGTPGQFLVTAVTGTTDGSMITGILPVDTYPFAFGGGDNLLFDPAVITVLNINPGYLDVNGLSYALLNGTDINLYFGLYTGTGSNDVYNLIHGTNNTNDVLTSFTLVDTSLTPEPASFLLLATGALGLLGVARRRIAA